MLISSHTDGQIIARTVAHLGIDTVEGSTAHRGGAALRALLKTLKSGICVGITPDGPRGPLMRASDGVIQLARLAGVPVIPCTVATARRRLLGSWDRFALALPFSRGVFIWGNPIAVAREADGTTLDEVRVAVERALNAITADADARMGHEPLAPRKATP
jgi:lysophospholipid acyltransferase (LPLAT)-like uncharacterized protein